MTNNERKINIIGAGLAGSEAAWQAAERGARVRLFEMRPAKQTPAHTGGHFAELVCSNSLRAAGLGNAVGLLKAEMRLHGSLIMQAADHNRVPAGGALAVDREGFGREITERLKSHPRVEVVLAEVRELEELLSGDDLLIIAAGPLASPALSTAISSLVDREYLHFHDAVAPIVDGETIDFDIAFRGSRYGRGDNPDGDYINCPMSKEEYLHFYEELVAAATVPLKDFEREKDFAGCMPIESMAKKGVDTIRFGPLKPVGLPNPHDDGREAYAIVQLRQDNAAGTMFNIVGFQTRLTWGEQRRVFRLIPGLANAEFLRYGVMHRNTFINSPQLLSRELNLKANSNVYFAGQITGVEGYVESAACGLAAGINASRALAGEPGLVWDRRTALGGLLSYITTPNGNFQPMNVTFGLIEPIDFKALGIKRPKKREKNEMIAERALEVMQAFVADSGL